MKWHRKIGKLLKTGTLWSTIGFIFTIILQIFARFFLESAPSWTEEASRLFFIYAISFGAGLALKNSYYVHLDMFYNSFTPRIKKMLHVILPMITFILFFVLLGYAVQLILLGLPEKSPSMGFSMGFAFVSIFLMAASICFYAGIQMIIAYKNQK